MLLLEGATGIVNPSNAGSQAKAGGGSESHSSSAYTGVWISCHLPGDARVNDMQVSVL